MRYSLVVFIFFGLLASMVSPINAAYAKQMAKKKVITTTKSAPTKSAKKTIPALTKKPVIAPTKASSSSPTKIITPNKVLSASKNSVKTEEKKISQPETKTVTKPEKKPTDDTKKKTAELLEKLKEIKVSDPPAAKKFDSSLTEPFKAPPVSNPWTDDYPGEDSTMREYYRQHPGAYNPPLLNY